MRFRLAGKTGCPRTSPTRCCRSSCRPRSYRPGGMTSRRSATSRWSFRAGRSMKWFLPGGSWAPTIPVLRKIPCRPFRFSDGSKPCFYYCTWGNNRVPSGDAGRTILRNRADTSRHTIHRTSRSNCSIPNSIPSSSYYKGSIPNTNSTTDSIPTTTDCSNSTRGSSITTVRG